jgi:hypothetical protein
MRYGHSACCRCRTEYGSSARRGDAALALTNRGTTRSGSGTRAATRAGKYEAHRLGQQHSGCAFQRKGSGCGRTEQWRVELLRHVDAWRAVMLQRGVVRSRAEAMAWRVHTDLGAPRDSDDTARVRRELRQAAWSFWRSTRRHKESLPVPPAALCPCPVPLPCLG